VRAKLESSRRTTRLCGSGIRPCHHGRIRTIKLIARVVQVSQRSGKGHDICASIGKTRADPSLQARALRPR